MPLTQDKTRGRMNSSTFIGQLNKRRKVMFLGRWTAFWRLTMNFVRAETASPHWLQPDTR
jgi:hypothetical protein